jgi:cytochrome c553
MSSSITRTILGVALTLLALAPGCGVTSHPGGGASTGKANRALHPQQEGAAVFASSGCGSCHTLDGASASGQIGPNLDQIKPTYATVLRQVASGGNGMPSFDGKLSRDAMRAVARFVSTSAARSPAPPRFRPDRRSPADCGVDFACLKQAYGNIAFYHGPETALERLDRAQRASQAIAGFCHQITHEIGHAALARYDGDSAKALGHGTMTCWSGYYHGVVERAFAGVPRQLVAAKARRMCAVLSSATLFVRYQCVHGLGHGLMIYSAGDLAYSLEVCHALTGAWDQQSCTGGVFMQSFLPPMPGMTAATMQMSPRQKRDLVYPCNAVAQRDKLYCYLQITSRILPVVNYDWHVAATWCRRAEHSWIATCFQSLGRDVSGFSRENVGQIVELCALAKRFADECLYGAVRDVASNDAAGTRASKLCLMHVALGPGRCFEAVGSILGGLANSRTGRRQLCDASAAPAYRTACYRGAAAL